MRDKFKLTLEMLKNAKPVSVLHYGEIIDSPDGLHINRTGKLLSYVIVRGGIADWAIYQTLRELAHPRNEYFDTETFIKEKGDKVGKFYAKAIVEADKEVWDRYRG